MKEFVLVPVSEFRIMQDQKQAMLSGSKGDIHKHMKDMISTPNISSDNLLKMLSSLQGVDRQSTDAMLEKDSTGVKTEEHVDDGVIRSILNHIPENLRSNGKEIIDHLLKVDGVKMDNLGYLSINHDMVRVENLLKALLIKNSGISSLKQVLGKVLPHIPDQYIHNNKVKKLLNRELNASINASMSGNENVSDQVDSPILTGLGGITGKIYIPPTPLKMSKIRWVHFC